MAVKRVLEWLFFGFALCVVLPRLPMSFTGLAVLALVFFFLLPKSE